MLDQILEEFSLKYDFITEKMKDSIRKEYKDTNLTLQDLRYELQEKINHYIKEEKIKKKKFIPLTNYVSYHQETNSLHYHLIPIELLSYIKDFIKKANGNKEEGYKLYQDFFKEELIKALDKTSSILENNNNIKIVMATSTKMISFHKDVFKELGFDIYENDDIKLTEIFPDKTKEEREKYRLYASISREDVLNKTYKKENSKSKVRIKNDGYVNNIFLLSIGLVILTYLIIELGLQLLKV